MYAKNSITLTILLITIFLQNSNCAYSQISVSRKVDTTQNDIKSVSEFIKKYMSQDTVNSSLWHPKYKNKIVFNYNMDWNWNDYTPKKMCEKFDVGINEIQKINDTLFYCKILLNTRPLDKNSKIYNSIYKYYVVRIGENYCLDNCKSYDSNRFTVYKTKNIKFYVSPFYNIDKLSMNAASDSIEVIRNKLHIPDNKKPIEYYMCASEEELNNMSNIIVWNGGLTGYTNIPDGYVFGINKNPIYVHEFIHALLGTSTDCFFTQEGVATLYGGSNKGLTTYEAGIKELKLCYGQGKCTFEKLYKREVYTQFSNSLSYTFAAVICDYIISNFGLDFFYKIYYDKKINSNNFLDKLSEYTGKPKDVIKKSLEDRILL